MNPGEALAVLEGVSAVGRAILHRGVDWIIVPDDLDVFGLPVVALAFQRQGQQGQRIRLHQQRARRCGIAEGVSLVGSQHLVGMYHWPQVARVGVGHQDVGIRRVTCTRGDVQVVAQCVSAAAQHEGVLFVRVVAHQRRIVLIIHRAGGLGPCQITRAHALRDHDLRRIARVRNRVAADLSRHIKVAELRRRRGHLLEPTHDQGIATRLGVDRYDRPQVRRVHASGEGIGVARGIIAGTAGNIAAQLMASWRHQPIPDRGRRRLDDSRRLVTFNRIGEGRTAIGGAAGRAEGVMGAVGDTRNRSRPRDGRPRNQHSHFQTDRAIHCNGRHAAGRTVSRNPADHAAVCLGVKIHVPRRSRSRELQQAAVAPVRAGTDQHRLRQRIQARLGPGRVVLIDDRGQCSADKFQARVRRTTSVIDGLERVIGQIRRPAQPIRILILRPLNSIIPLFQPIKLHIVIGGLARRIPVIRIVAGARRALRVVAQEPVALGDAGV